MHGIKSWLRRCDLNRCSAGIDRQRRQRLGRDNRQPAAYRRVAIDRDYRRQRASVRHDREICYRDCRVEGSAKSIKAERRYSREIHS